MFSQGLVCAGYKRSLGGQGGLHVGGNVTSLTQFPPFTLGMLVAFTRVGCSEIK